MEPRAQVVRMFAAPSPALAPFVDRFWSWEGPPDCALPLALPGTGAELFFHHGGPFRAGDPEAAPLAPAHLLCPRSAVVPLFASGPVGFLAVRLRAGALRHLALPAPAELADALSPLGEVLGPDGERLRDEVGAASGFAARVAAAEAGLLRILAARGARLDAGDRAVARIYAQAGRERVADVARVLGTSARQLERVVDRAVGLGPKRFARLARFHHAVRGLLLVRRADPLDAALGAGFHDQAHFIHEVRALTGFTPGSLLRAAAQRSHFYNPSLARSGIPSRTR